MKKFTLLLSCVFLINSCSETPLEPNTFKLTTSANPPDGGTVSPPTSNYEIGESVTVNAVPAAEYIFESWTGVSGSSASTKVVMNSDLSVIGNFVKKKYPLNIEIQGQGTVDEKIIKQGIATDYNSGTVVELTAIPKDGWEFKEWTGDLSGTENPINITIDKAKTVKAIFGGNPIFYIDNGESQIGINYALMDNQNIIITGTYDEAFKDLNDLGFSTSGVVNSFIISISENGQINWGKDITNNIISHSGKVIKSNDGNYIRWVSIPDVNETNINGEKDILLQKFSETGELVWDKRISGTEKDYVADAIENDDTSITLLANSRSRDKDFSEITAPQGTAFLLHKTDSNGNTISSVDLNEGSYNLKQWEWTKLEGRLFLDFENNNKLIIGGNKQFQEPTFPISDKGVNMAMFDSSYDLIWKKFYKMDIYNLESAKEISGGDFILLTTYNVNNAENAQITRINSNGELIWKTELIEEGFINDMLVNDSEIIIIGYKSDYAFTKSYSSDGILNWEKKYEGENLYVWKIIKNSSGYVLIGRTKENTGLFSENPIKSGERGNLF
ncbi:MAG: hypothetical protein L7S44_06520, partial [Flavobacteriaceae bacterium]|nr:hypothetical protein [Flavobacteriaceae bacterium]